MIVRNPLYPVHINTAAPQSALAPPGLSASTQAGGAHHLYYDGIISSSQSLRSVGFSLPSLVFGGGDGRAEGGGGGGEGGEGGGHGGEGGEGGEGGGKGGEGRQRKHMWS